jgi:hypothetical protein
MEEEKKPVEAEPQTAGTEAGVKESDAPSDIEVELAAVRTEKAKVEQERDNYKKGLLIAKGKREDDGTYEPEPENSNLDDLIDRKVTEKLLSVREQELQKKEQDTINRLIKERNELKTALQAKTGMGNSAIGGGTGGPEVQDSTFTKEQLAAMKARGLDPEKVKANYLKQAGRTA